MTLAGKTAVVTGASRGIGQAIAQGLAQRGANVIVNYAKDADGAAATVQAITTAGGEARALQADVADFKAAEGLIKAAVEAYGSLDILVNNAGTTRDMVIMLIDRKSVV